MHIIKNKVKNFFKWIWNECKDWHTIVILLCVAVVVYFPVWGCYLLYALLGWTWCSVVASACLVFWAGPFTPFFPLCIAITLSIKKGMELRKKRIEKTESDPPVLSEEAPPGKVLSAEVLPEKALSKEVLPEEALQEAECNENEQVQINSSKITYDKLFWLFLIGSILGVIIEGLFCLIKKGHWESHVVTIWGSFNILYGAGAVLFYAAASVLRKRSIVIKVVIMTIVATILELICGLILKYGLGMKAWNYEHRAFNYKGLICLEFSISWGVAAFIICLLYPKLDALLGKFKGKACHCTCVVLSVFMVCNISLTGISIFRWSTRHYNVASESKFWQPIDEQMPDEWMENRFVEWRFLE